MDGRTNETSIVGFLSCGVQQNRCELHNWEYATLWGSTLNSHQKYIVGCMSMHYGVHLKPSHQNNNVSCTNTHYEVHFSIIAKYTLSIHIKYYLLEL